MCSWLEPGKSPVLLGNENWCKEMNVVRYENPCCPAQGKERAENERGVRQTRVGLSRAGDSPSSCRPSCSPYTPETCWTAVVPSASHWISALLRVCESIDFTTWVSLSSFEKYVVIRSDFLFFFNVQFLKENIPRLWLESCLLRNLACLVIIWIPCSP